MKIKVIQLINKIANKEKVPNKIKIYEDIYEWDNLANDYRSIADLDYFSDSFDLMDNKILNDEAEIIEEPKKIEKLKKGNMTRNQTKLANKINELIDEVNKLKGD